MPDPASSDLSEPDDDDLSLPSRSPRPPSASKAKIYSCNRRSSGVTTGRARTQPQTYAESTDSAVSDDDSASSKSASPPARRRASSSSSKAKPKLKRSKASSTAVKKKPIAAATEPTKERQPLPSSSQPSASFSRRRSGRQTLSSHSTDSDDTIPSTTISNKRKARPSTAATDTFLSQSSFLASPRKKLAFSPSVHKPSLQTYSSSSNLGAAFPSSSQGSTLAAPEVWSLKGLGKVVWVRLAPQKAEEGNSTAGVGAEMEERAFWWPAMRLTPNKDLKRECCQLKLFMPSSSSSKLTYSPPFTIRNLSSSKIVNLLVGSSRSRFTFDTFAMHPSSSPTPSSPKSSSQSSSLPSSPTSRSRIPSNAYSHSHASSSQQQQPPLLRLSSITPDSFDTVVKLAKKEHVAAVSRELAASSSDDSDDDGLLKTSKGKGKGKEKATGSDVDTEEEDEEAAFAKQQMDELRSASQIQLDLVGDDQDAEEISFNDGDRVFAQIEGQWWGALIVGEKTLGKKGEACYPCRFAWMSEGKSKLIWEKRIKPLSRLYTIDYQPWGQVEPLPLSSSKSKSISSHQRASSSTSTSSHPIPAPLRALTPLPSTFSSRPFSDLDLWEQIVLCRPTLHRIIKGEYAPVLERHRQYVKEGRWLDAKRAEGLGEGEFGCLTYGEVEKWVIPELLRWMEGTEGTRGGSSGVAGDDEVERELEKEVGDAVGAEDEDGDVTMRPGDVDKVEVVMEIKGRASTPSPPSPAPLLTTSTADTTALPTTRPRPIGDADYEHLRRSNASQNYMIDVLLPEALIELVVLENDLRNPAVFPPPASKPTLSASTQDSTKSTSSAFDVAALVVENGAATDTDLSTKNSTAANEPLEGVPRSSSSSISTLDPLPLPSSLLTTSPSPSQPHQSFPRSSQPPEPPTIEFLIHSHALHLLSLESPNDLNPFYWTYAAYANRLKRLEDGHRRRNDARTEKGYKAMEDVPEVLVEARRGARRLEVVTNGGGEDGKDDAEKDDGFAVRPKRSAAARR